MQEGSTHEKKMLLLVWALFIIGAARPQEQHPPPPFMTAAQMSKFAEVDAFSANASAAAGAACDAAS